MKIETVIEDVVMQPMKIQPIIVNFKNGKLKNEEANKFKCNIFYDEAKNKTVLGMANNQTVYRGYRPDPKDESLYTMLAIHNKRTGKVRLIQAERWDVLPVLNDKPDRDDGMDVDKIAVLNKQFGSKKVKRRTEQHERMKVHIDSVKDQLEKAAASTEIERDELEGKVPDSTSDWIVPPCNRDATVVEDVYDVCDIVPMDKLGLLCEKVDEIVNSDMEKKSQFYLETLKFIESGRQKEKKVAILEYMDGVCRWLNIHVRDAKRKRDEICPFDTEISTFITDTYSMQSASGRTRPMSMRDKAIIHCMILALMINNYQLNLDLFCDHIKSRMGRKKLSNLSRIIGAVPCKENKSLIILKLPLPPPPSLIKRGKKMK